MGRNAFVLRRGVLGWGLTMCGIFVGMRTANHPSNFLYILATNVPLWLGTGGLWGIAVWYTSEWEYKRYLAKQAGGPQHNPGQPVTGLEQFGASQPGAGERIASILRRAVLVVLGLALVGLCVAQVRPLELLTRWTGLVEADPSPDTEPLRWLKSGDYAAIDRYYTALQRQFERGGLTDSQLYGEFRKLYHDDPANGPYFDQWVQHYPSSYAARVAQGTYYYRMAWAVRGDAFVQQTSPLRLYLMDLYLGNATDILQRSLLLSPRPYLSSLYLLNIAMMHGTPEEARHWLDLGTSLDPDASLVRLRYMVTLQPRWGGSLEKMGAYVADCEREGVAAQTLARLKWNLVQEEIYATARTASVDRRIDLFNELALEARAAGADPPPMALAGLARIYWDQHRRAEADRLLSQIDVSKVEDAWVLEQMGYVYVKEQRMAEGWNVLLKSAQLGDAWSQFVVGKTLINGCVDIHMAPNRAAGLRWITRAAKQGFGEAVTYLARAQWADL